METLDSQEDCKHSNKDKQMSIGRKKFNMDPKKGRFFFIFIFALNIKAFKMMIFLWVVFIAISYMIFFSL